MEGDYDDGRASNLSTLGSMSAPSTPSTEGGGDSPPVEPSDDGSRGSSASSVQEEYEDALRHAQIRPLMSAVLRTQHAQRSQSRTSEREAAAAVRRVVEKAPTPAPAAPLPTARPKSPARPRSAESAAAHTTTTSTFEEELEVSALDGDITTLENELDAWCGTLKKAVLAEFSHTKVRLLQRHAKRIDEERRACAARLASLQAECASLREHAHASEQAQRSRELVIERLLALMKAQRDSGTARAAFDRWRQQHVEARREGYAMRLAEQHHRRALMRRAFEGWHGLIQANWRERAERACQARAEEVCRTLTVDYEERLRNLRAQLETAREEISVLHRQQEEYNEKMKKAFMRGVCALNMEAMSMFRGSAQAPSH